MLFSKNNNYAYTKASIAISVSLERKELQDHSWWHILIIAPRWYTKMYPKITLSFLCYVQGDEEEHTSVTFRKSAKNIFDSENRSLGINCWNLMSSNNLFLLLEMNNNGCQVYGKTYVQSGSNWILFKAKLLFSK